ncbi:hypothetical protein C7212DRAFT_230854 [Tuber magnatum]|uniref:Uncharacterized protein n=1 Tax=Tuber magnatum TaxID=42249 RepID=A0A317SDH8_9PEZI|nr:hypothetical protein C7212DRAFT_230854 [Tuber magnatum]
MPDPPPPPPTSIAPPQNPIHLDPLLKPFLSPAFSPSAYLNSTLPPLLPPPNLNPAGTPRPVNAEPLSTLSSKTTTLLSTLDLQTQTLISTLQSQADEILRLAPRLGYEVDLLRSDAVSLAASLNGDLDGCVRELRLGEGEEGGEVGKEELRVLEKLRMLSRVRSRLEDVVKVFGHAMDWTLEGPGEAEGAGQDNLAPPSTDPIPRTPSPIRALRGAKKMSGSHPVEDVLYHLSTGDLDGARRKVAELRELCKIFEGTVEGPARKAVVEALEGRVGEEEAKREAERLEREGGGGAEEEVEKSRSSPDRNTQSDERVEGSGWAGGREGYYGFINQLSRMRGNMT